MAAVAAGIYRPGRPSQVPALWPYHGNTVLVGTSRGTDTDTWQYRYAIYHVRPVAYAVT